VDLGLQKNKNDLLLDLKSHLLKEKQRQLGFGI